MKQLKAESEQFRRTKANMAKEMLQLKSQVNIATYFVVKLIFVLLRSASRYGLTL